MRNKTLILIIIVLAQFSCTSLWFAGNSIVSDLAVRFNFSRDSISSLTSAVQFGFISGTLVYALLAFADRFSPSKVFFVSALLAAAVNLGHLFDGNTLSTILIYRFLVGFFLAGIYPVGMKIAADHFDKELGKSLGYLVGALVLGTAFPHFMKSSSFIPNWEYVVFGTSIIAFLGGLLMFVLVPDGPYRKKGGKAQLTLIPKIFKNQSLRDSAAAYFGHMWELYTFWAMIPFMLSQFTQMNSTQTSLWSFVIIGSGSLSCAIGGILALKIGPNKVARVALIISGFCCLLSPLIFNSHSQSLILMFLVIWGLSVIADSPMLSTMVAQSAEPATKGTALTIVNCIGFAITIVSIQLLSRVDIDPQYLFLILAVGPLISLWKLRN